MEGIGDLVLSLPGLPNKLMAISDGVFECEGVSWTLNGELLPKGAGPLIDADTGVLLAGAPSFLKVICAQPLEVQGKSRTQN